MKLKVIAVKGPGAGKPEVLGEVEGEVIYTSERSIVVRGGTPLHDLVLRNLPGPGRRRFDLVIDDETRLFECQISGRAADLAIAYLRKGSAAE